MHQTRRRNSYESLSMTTNHLDQNIEFNNQLPFSNKQTQQTRTTIYHKTTNTIRSKSADYPRSTSQMLSSSNVRSTITSVDEFPQIEKEFGEQRRLTILNNRFANYLTKIKTLADININLRRQIDDFYQKYMKNNEAEEEQQQQQENNKNNNNYNSSKVEFNNLRQQLNNEIRQSTSLQIRLQRADHDKKYYRNKLKYFSTSDQNYTTKQQLDASLFELNLIKEQYKSQEQNLQSYKNQYNEYMIKINEYIDKYNSITFERIQSENSLYTLKEQLSFEHEYNYRCQKEFEYLEKIQFNLNNYFNKTELNNIIKKIREDYKEYNDIQLTELEQSYKIKLETIQNNFYTKNEKQEDYSIDKKEIIEQNRLLQQKLKQLENDLHDIIEQNRQQYETSLNEYDQLSTQLFDLESLIQNSRDNTIYLSSEINTYRCLLINLSSQEKSKPSQHKKQTTNYTVHFDNGLMWIRI